MKMHEFEIRIKQTLNHKASLSEESELELFTRAENLLLKRRELFESREALARKASISNIRRLVAIRQFTSRVLEFFAIHPDAPAAVTTMIVLVLAFAALYGRLHGQYQAPILSLTYSDMPALPKTNDFQAKYDAQILAERQAYEREVEDAHQKTNGGI